MYKWLLALLVAILVLFFLFLPKFQSTPNRSILIWTCKVPGNIPWDKNNLSKGITGSEEAVIQMAEELAKLGYKVCIVNDAPVDSSYRKPEANPRYGFSLEETKEKFDIALAWRFPEVVADLKKYAHRVYLWPHDSCTQIYDQEVFDSIQDVLWISKWQRAQWSSKNPTFAKYVHIFGNGINPKQFKKLRERKNPYSCIYGSNYSQGLEQLLDIWPEVKKNYPQATLDIYYGWNHWGLLAPKTEAKMRKQIKDLESLDVHEHGLVSQYELNEAYAKASLWTYPCSTYENFCISALRAQGSGAIPVIIEKAALCETVLLGYRCKTKEEYLALLLNALKQAPSISLKLRESMSEKILKEYTWERVAKKWHKLFEAQNKR